MEIPNTDMIEYLLPRYCSGEATVEECRQVEEWIRQSGENYRVAKQIHTLYLATDTMQVLSKVDTEKALSSVCQKMSEGNTRPKVTVVTWLQRVAAILFIPLSSSEKDKQQQLFTQFLFYMDSLCSKTNQDGDVIILTPHRLSGFGNNIRSLMTAFYIAVTTNRGIRGSSVSNP